MNNEIDYFFKFPINNTLIICKTLIYGIKNQLHSSQERKLKFPL